MSETMVSSTRQEADPVHDPTALYHLTDREAAGAKVLLVCLGGFVDAGQTQRLLTSQLLAAHEHTTLARFAIDELYDYRGRRPPMIFEEDRWAGYEAPALDLYRIADDSGQPFLMLAGDEPDYQWERMVDATAGLAKHLGVELTVSVHGIPMAVPHTRPLGLTAHATDKRLLGQHQPVFGKVQVPASWSALYQYRLGERDQDAVGFAIHVPHYLSQAEYADAAVAGLAAVTRATGLVFSLTELTAKAGENREAIAKELEGSEEVTAVVAALEQQYDAFVAGQDRPSLLTQASDMPSADELGAEFEEFLRGMGGPSRDPEDPV